MFLFRLPAGTSLRALACFTVGAGAVVLFSGARHPVHDIRPGAGMGAGMALLLFLASVAAFEILLVRRRKASVLLQRQLAHDDLTEQLLLARRPEDVVRGIERFARRVLPGTTANFWPAALALKPGARGGAGSAPETDAPGTRKVEARSSRASKPRLVIPDAGLEFSLTHQDTEFGVLRVGSRPDGEPFPSRDIELLRRVCHAASLALAHVISREELENSLRQQASAFRDEREALVETLSAEILHEMRYPINFFRSVFQRAGEGTELEPQDIEIGREEVDRLERLVSGLRRVARQPLERRTVEIAELLARAEGLLRDRLDAGRIHSELADDLALRCDPDKVTQILVNLLANALDAASDNGGDVGVIWSRVEGGAELMVWDTGPGFGNDTVKLFTPWYTTKARGTGLGLAISSRLVRAHGWHIDAQRDGDRTLFVVRISGKDLVGADVQAQSGTRQISSERGAVAENDPCKQQGVA